MKILTYIPFGLCTVLSVFTCYAAMYVGHHAESPWLWIPGWTASIGCIPALVCSKLGESAARNVVKVESAREAKRRAYVEAGLVDPWVQAELAEFSIDE